MPRMLNYEYAILTSEQVFTNKGLGHLIPPNHSLGRFYDIYDMRI